MKKVDLTGKVFGKLTVLKEVVRKTPYYAKYYLCRCECGREKEVASSNLVRGTTKSCGQGECKQRPRNLIDRVGQVLGSLTVIKEVDKPLGCKSRVWLCRCKCGDEIRVRDGNLRRQKSCKTCHQKSRVGVPNLKARGPRPCVQREKNVNWKGGRQIDGNGYIRVYEVRPGDTERTRVLEHRWVMEQRLGRKLFRNENVHHLDGNRANNKADNLELWVKSQPAGSRVSDQVNHAIKILSRYKPEYLVGKKLKNECSNSKRY